jgi:hypothetical protein
LSRCGGALLQERVAHVAVLLFIGFDDVWSEHRNVGEHKGVPERSEQSTRREVPEDAVPQAKELDRHEWQVALANPSNATESCGVERRRRVDGKKGVDDGLRGSYAEIEHAEAVRGEA